MSLSIRGRSGTSQQRLLSVLTALALAAASCTSLHQVPSVPTLPGQSAAWQVKPGDYVGVTLRDGTELSFTVASVAPDAIISTLDQRFSSTEIQSMRRRGVSGPKTVLFLVVAPVALLLAAVVVFGGELWGGS